MGKIEVTQQTLDFIIGWEGFHSTSYYDVSRWSIGYGTPAKEHETITQAQAIDALGADLARRAARLEKQLDFAPTLHQATALLSAVYNLGSCDTVVAYCNAGLFDKAANELRKYCHAGGKKLPALVRRREAEARLLEMDTMTRGAPRVDYSRVYHLLDNNASIDQFVAMAREAYEARETIGFSYDDAGIGDLENRTVVLHGSHPDNIESWFQEHYSGVKVVRDRIEAPTPPRPDSGSNKALVGLHGSADGSWGNPVLPETVKMIEQGKIEAYKALSNESADTVDVLTPLGVQFYLVRLMGKVNADSRTVDEFVNTVGEQCLKWYAKGVRHFEIHNEPNLAVEGMWSVWKDGSEFALWWKGVRQALEGHMPDALWGFPGLSPGFSMDKVRYDPTRFYSEAWLARDQSDFICAHCYWQTADQMRSADGGDWYLRYDHLHKPLMITEFSNPSHDVDKDTKAHQYVEYYAGLQNVHSAYSFLSTASSGFDSEVWSGSNIATIVGQRNGRDT